MNLDFIVIIFLAGNICLLTTFENPWGKNKTWQ